MIAFQRGAAGVVKLKNIQMQMTGNDYETMPPESPVSGKYACGSILRPECCVEIMNSQ